MLRRIGKSSQYTLKYQTYLIDDFETHKREEKKFEFAYAHCSRLIECIICEKPLNTHDFTRNDIKFFFCDNCGHINGGHVLSDNLVLATYDTQTDDAMNYDKHYIQTQEEFDSAVIKIYQPKAEFLLDALRVEFSKSEIKLLEFLDFGTGSGHMVKALQDLEIPNVVGVDPMQTTVDCGIDMGVKGLIRVGIQDSIPYLQSTTAAVVCMICTLPHVSDHNGTLEAMIQNSNIKYTFQKLPMFSLASMLDIVHPEMNSRVISGSHTHAYTNSSLEYMEEKYGLTRIAEWRFGSDIVDLYRNLQIGINKSGFSKKFTLKLQDAIYPIIDRLQLVLDDGEFASEIHILWKFNR